jgi:hypothetical protein
LPNWLLGGSFILSDTDTRTTFLWFVKPATQGGFAKRAKDAQKALVGCEKSLDLIIGL